MKDKDFELSPEVKAGVEAEKKIAELNRQKREATSPSVTDVLEEEGLEYLEGYLRALDDQERLKQVQTAMALYYIHKNQLYKERGFKTFKEYCEARKINRSVAYEWVKNIEEFGIKDFVVLTDKTGAVSFAS